MPQISRFKLFDKYLPLMLQWYNEHQYDEEGISDEFLKALDTMRYGTVFDCRPLPIDFVLDSGDGYSWSSNWLPYQECYFEFADGTGIVAWQEFDPNPLRRNLAPIVFSAIDDVPFDPADGSLHFGPAHYGPDDSDGQIRFPAMAGLFGVLDADNWKPEPGRTVDDWLADMKAGKERYIDQAELGHSLNRRAAILLIGIRCLLTEKLVLDRIQSDRMPHLNKARQKKGKLPLDADHHVLTLYVPGIEYAVSHGSKEGGGGTHASPVLHWRRGHVRTLRRGTGSQSQTSVRRHLVGDPDKGFVKHSYRLVPRPSALFQDDADE